MIEFLIGLALGLGIAVAVHIYHSKIIAVANAEAADLKTKLATAESKLTKI
jgi:hypothetical protein